MLVIRGILLVILAVTCLLLIGAVLIQRSKGGGLGLAFGAGVGESLFGAQTGNVLTKITIGLAVTFLVCTTLLAFTFSAAVEDESLVDRLPDEPVRPAPAEPGVAPLVPEGMSAEPGGAAVPEGGAEPLVSAEDMAATEPAEPAPVTDGE